MEAMTISSATRSERAVDHIPGSVMAIPAIDLANIQFSSMDPDQMLAQAIPGYTASLDDLTTSGELLRGRRPQFFLDGVLMSTPLRDVGRMASGMTDPLLIDRIEVINGASAIEGLGGSGGIINYITKTPTQEGVFTTLQTAVESQPDDSKKIGWKATGLTMVKRKNVDFLVSFGTQDRPMYYDAKGNLEYINTNGSYEDSQTKSVAAKLGYVFGANNEQRLQLTFSNYDLVGNNNYNSILPGNRAAGIVQSAARGAAPGKAAENFMRITMANYTNTGVAGGTLKAIAYLSSENILNNATGIDASKQDPRIAPIGTLIDESQIVSRKQGVKTYWVRPDFIVQGLEFNAGYDYANDKTYQNLLLTGRTWLPTMNYTGNSGYVQMAYDRGPLTLSAGGRYQAGSISVPTFQTLYMTAPATYGVTVLGGKKTYTTSVVNFGAVYRLWSGWSAFVGFSQGYDLPDIGTVIRNTSKPNQSISTIAAIDAIKTSNYETGINWHGTQGSMGLDVYYARSPSTTTVVTDPNTQLQVVLRNPIERKGIEFSGEWKFTPTLRLSGTYSKMLAYTSSAPGFPVNLTITPASAIGQDPDKGVLRLDWIPVHRWAVDLVGTNFWRQQLNVGKSSTLYWHESGYALFDGSISYHSDSWGTLAFGCSNILNKFHIVTETGTSNLTYYSIIGRKFTLTHTITF